MASLGGTNVLLFGGVGADGFDIAGASTWIFNQKTSDWMEVKTTASSSPSHRANFAMALLGESRNVILFGGWDFDNPFKDTWVFDQRKNEWKEIHPSTSSPSARYAHAMASIGKSNNVVMFGGSDNTKYFQDTWIFKQSLSDWIEISPASSPSARRGHAMASLGDIQKVVLFGGSNSSFLQDTWIFDSATTNWKEIILTNSPPGRAGHAMASMGNTAVMYGGFSHSDAYLDDTWLLHLESTNNWKWTQLSTQMAGRANHAMATISTGIVLFGGYAEYQMGTSLTTSRANDTWFIPNG
jgi:hypothetical protein